MSGFLNLIHVGKGMSRKSKTVILEGIKVEYNMNPKSYKQDEQITQSVFFFCNIFPNNMTIGITKKVFAQIKALENNGFFVKYYTGYFENGAAVYDRNGKIVYQRNFHFRNKLLRRVTRNKLLKKVSKEFLINCGETFSLCYARYLFADSKFIGFLKAANKTCDTVIVEAHCYPYYSKKNIELYPVYVVDYINRIKLKKYVDYIVAVARGYKTIFGIKTICIDNGIDISTITEKKKTESQDIRLIAVAYETPLHGFDLLIRGLKEYYEGNWNKIVTLKFVGTVMGSTKKMIYKYGLQKYVQILGKQYGESLDKCFDNSDIGIGSLALYRAGIHETGRELKTREYIARGLPYICTGYKEDEEWYDYVFPCDKKPIDINEVIRFYERISLIDDCSHRIRNEAFSKTWDSIFKEVFKEISNE